MRPFLPAALLLCILTSANAGLLPSNQPYVESGGIVQGPAEDYHAKAAGNGDDWLEAPTNPVVPTGVTFENALGAGNLFMQAQPDNGPGSVPFSGAGAGPSIDYKLQIATPGTYRLFLRWDGHDGASDSIYAGLLELADGLGGTHADWYEDYGHTTSDFGQQNWDGLGQAEVNVAAPSQSPMTWTISATDITANSGIFTLRVVAREDGVALDSFRLQLSTLPDPNPVFTSAANVIIGQDEFAYADGAIAGRNGGTNWDFDNTTNNGGFIGFTRESASTWDAVFGTPAVSAGKLTTLESGAKRKYGAPSEANGAVNDAGSTAYKQVYYRVQMTRAAGATWTGISSYDFGNELLFFGVPFNPPDPVNFPGVRKFGIEQGGTTTYSNVTVNDGETYTLVAKIDFVNDIMALYVNPDLSLPESANTPAAARTYTFGNWSTAVRLGSGGTAGTGAVTWDNLVVGTSWGAMQASYPTSTPVSGADVVVGTETFDYAGGNIAGRDGGAHFDFDNQNGDAFVGYTQNFAAWQNVGGWPYTDGQRQMLGTWDSSAKRNYGGNEANGAFNGAATSQYKQLYYRFEMIRSAAPATWSGASVYDGASERVLFGVPFVPNPSSGQREIGIHNLVSNTWAYTGIQPVIGARYFIVGKVDFAAGTASIFVNPDFSSATEPVPSATLSWTGGSSTGIRFGSGGGAPTWWDNVAVTTSWASVRTLFPTPVPASGNDLLIGADAFSYTDGSIAGKTGGLRWDFENRNFGDGAANNTLLPSNWDVSFGSPALVGSTLRTQDSAAIRQYNSTEADGAINKETGTIHRQVYYRFEMKRNAGATWSGASFFDFNDERLLVGVPFAPNPASGKREFAIHDLASGHTYSGVVPDEVTTPEPYPTFTIVAKLDYNASLVSMWVNPNLAQTEGANTPTITRAYTGLQWNTAIRLGSGGAAPTQWDNVAVGTSWRSIQAALTPPLTADDTVTMRHLSKVLLDVKRNDAGAGTVEIVTPPSSGTAVLDSEGRIRYTHTTGTPASDSMTYRLAGVSGQNSSPATVTFNFSSAMRLPNTTSTIPLAPPSTGLAVVDALPGVTVTTPTNMARVPGSSTKLLVAERTGKIWLIPDVTSPAPTKQLFMDLATDVVNPRADEEFDDYNEVGLKGIALHPNFATNRQFFVTYNVRVRANGSSPYVPHIRLSRFNATVDLSSGIPGSEQAFISQANDEDIHNIASARFGPDGYLYFGCGDEGFINGVNNSQRINLDFWSGIFRIDVDRLPGNIEPNPHAAIVPNPADSNKAFYKVPAGNPFIGATTLNGEPFPDQPTPAPVRTEFYAIGFRNPWQLSFDSQAPYEMWVGDVGAELWEEINVVTAGGNYQWAYKEGNVAGWKTNPPPGFSGTPPVWAYPHTNSAGGDAAYKGNSVTGGLVYRGTKYPTLTGKYVCADFVSGHIWTIVRNGASPPTVERIAGEAGIVAFEFDPSNGDILMLDYSDGKVRRLTTQTIDNSFPAKLSDTGIYADLADLSLNPGVEPYEINLPFWSDYARKSRLFMIPDTVSTFGYVRDGNWTLPTGAIWIKHFDFDQVRGNPATGKRLETRFLVKNDTGAYGVSYRWNDAGTEAYLVDDNGVDFNMNITVNGSPYVQPWRIPSRAECMACHTPQGGFALSWETRQLQRPGTLGGFGGNFLQLLSSAGYLSAPPGASTISSLPKFVLPTDTSHTLETRARSWLAVNCSYCHHSGGTGVGLFDLSPELALSSTNVINGTVFNAQQADHKAVVRGFPAKSVIYNRLAAANGYTRMPPLGTAELDPHGVQVVADWINEAASRQTYQEWRIANFGNGTSSNGAQSFDADGDGQTNFTEFLGFTQPQNGASSFRPGITTGGGNVTVHVPNLPGRLIKVQTSTDLLNWTLWNIPGNDGLPANPATGTRDFTAPTTDPWRFFKLEIEEQ